MVSNELIQSRYYRLIKVLEIEVCNNKNIYNFLSYIKTNEVIFVSPDAHVKQSELKEFVRGVNRFSDEFNFTSKHYSEIKQALYELYDVLNS